MVNEVSCCLLSTTLIFDSKPTIGEYVRNYLPDANRRIILPNHPAESVMQRVALQRFCVVLLIGSMSYGQSIADAARANRSQKSAAPTRVLTSDDLAEASTPDTIQLIPGSSSTGQGTLVAPGRGKHSYRVIKLDASRFANGGTIHITITVGDGASEASFDLYPQDLPLPSQGFPNSLANAVNLRSGSGGKIDYHFAHGTVFQFGAEGSWNSKAGATNTYSFVVDVDSQSTH
jgi:hypothetical protein